MADAPGAVSTGQKQKEEVHGYPEPFIVPPSGGWFGPEFLASKTAAGECIQDIFPGMKFIFPSAKNRRARWYNGAFINQWFDNVPIDYQSQGMSPDQVDWQLEGLAETESFLKQLLDTEIADLGSRNEFIGGLSQGCAMGLHLFLSFQFRETEGPKETDRLGGFIGMSGWLPFFDKIQDLAEPGKIGESLSALSQLSVAAQVCEFVRGNMGLPLSGVSEPAFVRTPVFLGHGKRDESVKMSYGLNVATLLREMGVQVRWEEYDEGHWYKVPEEIEHIVDFIRTCSQTCS